MSNLVCLTHPEYQAADAPELTCRNCCRIFISRVREENSKLSKRRQLWESRDVRVEPTALANLGVKQSEVMLTSHRPAMLASINRP